MINNHDVIVNGSDNQEETYHGISFLCLQYIENGEQNVNVIVKYHEKFLCQLKQVLIQDFYEWSIEEHTDRGYVQIQHGKIFLFNSLNYVDNGNITITDVDGFENVNVIKIPIL